MLLCGGASPDDVYEYYMNEIMHGGWDIVMNLKTGIYQVMLENGKNEASIIITSEDNETYALLSITKQVILASGNKQISGWKPNSFQFSIE